MYMEISVETGETNRLVVRPLLGSYRSEIHQHPNHALLRYLLQNRLIEVRQVFFDWHRLQDIHYEHRHILSVLFVAPGNRVAHFKDLVFAITFKILRFVMEHIE